jgi:predicted nucleotidyltransferase
MKVPGEIYSTDDIKQKLAPLFGEERVQFVLLFGSLVSKKATPQSDIDLAFLFDGPVDILTLTNQVIRLLHTDRVDVDQPPTCKSPFETFCDEARSASS